MKPAVTVAIVLTSLAGCATDTAYREGSRLIAEGREAEGVALLQEAVKANPAHAAARLALSQQQELAVSRMLAQAETARIQGNTDLAEQTYRELLKRDPGNRRAQSGLDVITADRRHAGMLRDAGVMLERKELTGAEAGVRAVISENPSNGEARQLLRKIIDVQATQALTSPALKAAAGRQVTLEFRDANIRSVFDVISRTTGLNFVFDKDVRADLRTTIMVRGATVDDVIRLILTTNQLDRKVLNDNTLLIYPNTPAKQRDYQDLVVRSFYIANADVKQVLNLVRTVVKTRDIYIDEKLNMLVMKDTAEAVRLAEKLIATQDLADPEVTLEVEVLEVGSSRISELGIRFPDRVLFQDPATVAAGAVAPIMRATGNLTGFVATPALVLNLRDQDGRATVLANPRIRVRNREKARIHIGDRVPVVTTTSTANVGVSASVSYLDVGLKLEVEPTIHLEGDVGIRVGLEVSNIVREVPTAGGGLAYQVGTRNATTTLRLRDGETQVLAGLIQDEDRSTANRLPGLGSLPVLGRLFSSTQGTRAKTEIVLLITPRVVRNLDRGDHLQTQFHSGTEAAVGMAPFTIGPVAAGSLSVSASDGGAAQSGQGTGGQPEASRSVVSAVPASALIVTAADKAVLGGDVAVRIALTPDPSVVSAQAELMYDAAMLEPVNAPAGGGKGRIPVRLMRSVAGLPGGMEIRFRVIATAPARTQLSVENVSVTDAQAGAVQGLAPVTARTLELVR